MLCTVILTLVDPNYSHNISEVILGALFLILGYGMIFWAMFIVSLLILDTIFIIPGSNYLRTKLIAEWVIISMPFVYWAFEYKEWVFVAGVVSFFITQLFREKLIYKIRS